MKTSCVIILACGKNCQSRYPPKDSLSLIPGCVQPERFRLHWQYTALWNFRWTSHRSCSSTYCSTKAPQVTSTTVLTQRYTTVQWYAVQSKNTSCVWSLIPSLNCELTIELKIHIKVRNVCYLWRMMSVLPLSGSWCCCISWTKPDNSKNISGFEDNFSCLSFETEVCPDNTTG